MLFQPGKIVQGLGIGLVQTLALGFVLNKKRSLPKQIDESILVVKLFDGFLKGGNAAAGNAEHIEKLIPKGFRLGVFAALFRPFLGKP
ncbi:hypothetical protein P4C99_02190 [Pontiellaceae bacterium B1224]|nr:hypothetical protein [Pontiellaceae bacterium B1224]